MSSLSKCLKQAGLSKHEAAILRGNTKQHVEDGVVAQEAAILAVQEHLDTLIAERADIVSQIEAQGGVVKQEAPPEAVAPVETALSPEPLADEQLAVAEQNSDDAVVTPSREDGLPDTPLFSRTNEPAPIFYSELARKVESLGPNVAPAQVWKGAIRNLTQKGVKQDEIEFSGINEFLDIQQGKVTKQQVVDFLEQNGVKVEETTLGKDAPKPYDASQLRIEERNDSWVAKDSRNLLMGEVGKGTVSTREEAETYLRRYIAERENEAAKERGQEDQTKFSSYQLPGGENYRELLLTLPVNLPKSWRIEQDKNDSGLFGLFNEKDELVTARRSRAALEGIAETYAREHAFDHNAAFRSSHFDQPNILAHIRFNERTDAEGKKVLFIEELQSDWAQKGKREGFKNWSESRLPPGYRWDQVKSVDGSPAWTIRNSDGIGIATGVTKPEAISQAQGKGSLPSQGVPSAPFVGKTEAWVALALKRMIRYASENGFDRIAFITGEQSADRYDLSKYVDQIGYQRRGELFNITVWGKQNEKIWQNQSATLKVVEDHVGKETATKISNGEGTQSGPTAIKYLSGLDLKVGGEGMKSFYDKIVPNVANDVLKKLGGGRVTTRDVSMESSVQTTGEEDENGLPADEFPNFEFVKSWRQQPGFDITPALREKAMRGIPLFNRGMSGNLSLDETIAFANNTVGKWANKPELFVTERPSQWGFEAPSDAQGAYWRDKLYLASSNHSTVEDLQVTIFHEGHGHMGFAGMGVDPRAFNQLWSANPKIRQATSKWLTDNSDVIRSQKMTPPQAKLRAIEEALADMAGRGQKINGLKQFLASVQRWLRSVGLNGIADQMERYSDAEALDLLSRARQWVEQGEGKTAQILTEESIPAMKVEAQFSRQPDWVTNGSPELKSAAGKIDTYAPSATIHQKIQGLRVNWKNRHLQGWFDQFRPLRELSPRAYILARMTKSADAVLEGTLLYGKPVLDQDGAVVGDLDGKGFMGAMQELNGEHDRFLMWVAGNRSERLMKENKEHLFTRDEIPEMKALNQGNMKDGSPRDQLYKTVHKTYVEYSKAVMDLAEETGLIDGQARHLWEHSFYVPFYRKMEDDLISGPSKIKGLVQQKAFKKLDGGPEPLGDLMANTLRNWSHLISASLANQAAVESLVEAERIGIAHQVPAGTKGSTFAMIAGKETHFIVDDPLVLTAISAMSAIDFKGPAMKVMRDYKRMLTLGTTVSPAFRAKNLIRDSISAVGVNKISYNIPGNIAKGFKGTKKGSVDYAQLLFGGGMMRFGTYLEGDRAANVKRLINAGVDDSTILNTPQKIKAAAGKLWDVYQEFGDRMENINRSALYQQLISEGKTHLEASFAARDMLDFSMQGSFMAVRFLSQVVPFFNARMQGLYKMGRAYKEDKMRLGYVSGAVAMTSIALMLAYEDDDDWKAREDWDRDSNWWFKIGEQAYRIPKPFEIGAIGTLAERGWEYAFNEDMTGKRLGERMRFLLLQTFAMNPVPQLFKPMIDIYANEDSFTGRQIESRGMENLSKAERMRANTSLVAQVAGSAGNVTDLSPVQVDHLIRAYFGWLGTHVAMTVDLMAEPFSENEKPTRRIGDMFVVGDFVKGLPQDQSRYVEMFYKQAKEVHEVMNDIKNSREIGDLEKAEKILEENKDKVGLSKLYFNAEQQMGEINKEIRLTQSRSSMTGDEKREQLDELTAMRNQLAKLVNEKSVEARR